MSDTPAPINRTKIRAGLAVISAVFVGSAVAFFLVSDAFPRAIFFAVALLALVRVALLASTLRREAKALRTS